MADTALNPRHRIADIIGRPLEFYFGLRGRKKRQRIGEILDMVELPQHFAFRYPASCPAARSSVSALPERWRRNRRLFSATRSPRRSTPSSGRNVIELLKKLRDQLGVSYVFISHDLSTVASFEDEIAVLYNGQLVDFGPTDDVLSPPFHPYTELLIASVPEMQVGWLDANAESQQALAANFKAGDYSKS